MLENIIFCLYWMSNEFNSGQIRTVIKWRFQDSRLELRHIDIIRARILTNSLDEEGTKLVRELEDSNEKRESARKRYFWEDLQKAEQAEMKWTRSLSIF